MCQPSSALTHQQTQIVDHCGLRVVLVCCCGVQLFTSVAVVGDSVAAVVTAVAIMMTTFPAMSHCYGCLWHDCLA